MPSTEYFNHLHMTSPHPVVIPSGKHVWVWPLPTQTRLPILLLLEWKEKICPCWLPLSLLQWVMKAGNSPQNSEAWAAANPKACWAPGTYSRLPQTYCNYSSKCFTNVNALRYTWQEKFSTKLVRSLSLRLSEVNPVNFFHLSHSIPLVTMHNIPSYSAT